MVGAERSDFYFMNVNDLINTAFGSLDANVVNFRLIRIVLYLLARQLKILERRVEVILPSGFVEPSSSSTFSVTEVKVHAVTKKETKKGHKSKKQDDDNDRESRVGKDGREGSKAKEGRYGRDGKTGKEDRDIKESRESKGGQDGREGRHGKKGDGKSKEGKDDREGKVGKDDREGKEGKDGREGKVGKDDREGKLGKDDREGKVSKDDREGKVGKDDREGTESGKQRRDKEHSTSRKSKKDKESSLSHEDISALASSASSKESQIKKIGDESKKEKIGKERKSEKEIKSDKERKQVKVSKEKSGYKQKRADSYEQPDESPTPMASVEEMETQHEKLLIVETVASEDKGLRGQPTPKTSLVTQEEFMQLANLVHELSDRFKIDDSADAQLMEELHKQASFTEAMAALQLSTRLEAAEKLLGRMVAVIGTIALVTPGIQLDDETRYILESYELTGEKGKKVQNTEKAKSIKLKPKPLNLQLSMDDVPITIVSEKSVASADKAEPEKLKQDCVTYAELDSELLTTFNEIMKEVTTITSRNVETADRAFKIASDLESKLDSSLNVGHRMIALENQIASYADQINALDTCLTSQMINYQEQLTQMQHELEIGLEAMSEALANAQGADTLAVTELNNNFIYLQTEQEAMTWQQKDIKQSHNQLANDLASLWKQIELLRDTKSDRDEVTDAFRDKAGIKDLNGLVSLEQFDAVRGDLEKRIASAYDKFNNQEIIWQKAIDDMLRELGEKADLIELLSLKDEINKYLTVMKERIKFMLDIVGEPKAAIVTKKLFRDTACISCSSPATMDIEEPDVPLALPKFPDRKKTDVETPVDKDQIKGDGDHKICYPGLPIPHPRHPRAHICTRYCGGSHTIITSGPPKVPPSMIRTPLPREVTTEQGVDGKMYQVEKIPCLPCNVPMKSEEPLPPPSPVIINEAPVNLPDAHEPNENDDIGCPRLPSTTSVPNTETETPPAIDEVL